MNNDKNNHEELARRSRVETPPVSLHFLYQIMKTYINCFIGNIEDFKNVILLKSNFLSQSIKLAGGKKQLNGYTLLLYIPSLNPSQSKLELEILDLRRVQITRLSLQDTNSLQSLTIWTEDNRVCEE